MSNKRLDDELFNIYIQDGKTILASLREIYELGKADAVDEALMQCTYSKPLNNEEYDKGFEDGVALVRKRLKKMQKEKENERV